VGSLTLCSCLILPQTQLFKEQKVDYDMVNKIEYLDMVISESMRIHPSVLSADRIANADYVYESYKIPKGSIFQFNVWVSMVK
jgi:cytochrome P450